MKLHFAQSEMIAELHKKGLIIELVPKLKPESMQLHSLKNVKCRI